MAKSKFDKDAEWGNERIRRCGIAMELMRSTWNTGVKTILEAHIEARKIMAKEDAKPREMPPLYDGKADVAEYVADLRAVGMWNGD